MAFPNIPRRAQALPRVHVEVFAVGRRVYVADGGSFATLIDGDKKTVATLRDGTEVSIVGWRPGWAGSTWYRVRTMGSDLVGWLPVGNLRATEIAASPAPATASPGGQSVRGEFGDTPRRFGERAR